MNKTIYTKQQPLRISNNNYKKQLYLEKHLLHYFLPYIINNYYFTFLMRTVIFITVNITLLRGPYPWTKWNQTSLRRKD